jgi:hypothetical protein
MGKAIGIPDVRVVASAHVVAFAEPDVGIRAGEGRITTTSSSGASRVYLESSGALNGLDSGGGCCEGNPGRGITGGRVGLRSGVGSVGDPASRKLPPP